MGAFSDYLENKLLDHVLGGPARTYPSPATVFISLHIGAGPGETGTPTNEVTGGGYSRQPGQFGPAALSVAKNSANVAFTNMPATTVTQVGIYDAATGGNLLFYGALTASKVVNAGDTFVINANDLQITLD